MNGSTRPVADERDLQAISTLRTIGYQVPDIQSLALDHEPFARRAAARGREIAPGVNLQARPVDLGAGCFTNVFTLTADLRCSRAEALSDAEGFHLRDAVGGDVVAGVSGSFSFISDDPGYQPAEPCLDFVYRAGAVAGLPTVTKPAFLVHRGRPLIRTLTASGTLTVAGRSYTWIGSKQPSAQVPRPGTFVVFGAANCRIRYRDDPRAGRLRDVDSSTNTTPRDPEAVDYTVSFTPADDYRITAVRPGGGADLFAGSFILCARRSWTGHPQLGAPVHITGIDGLDVRDLACGLSLGPSVADAAAGITPAYDQCLGTSPFQDARYARTLVGIHGTRLVVEVFDGAKHADCFRGVSPQEAASLCEAAGLDPGAVYHLDGGASSKTAYKDENGARVAGSLHYLQWPGSPTEPFRWRGLHGRVLHSCLVVRTSQGKVSQ